MYEFINEGTEPEIVFLGRILITNSISLVVRDLVIVCVFQRICTFVHQMYWYILLLGSRLWPTLLQPNGLHPARFLGP